MYNDVKTILEQYASIKMEIKDIERRILERREAIQKIEGGTSVETSSLWYVFEVPEEHTQRRLEMYRNSIPRAQKLKDMLCVAIERADVFIQQIGDSEIQKIIKLRIVDNLGWLIVANRMGEGYTEDYCRKKLCRYIEKYNCKY